MAKLSSFLTGRRAKLYEPHPRMLPYAAPIGNKLYMWGGRFQGMRSESTRRNFVSNVEVFDPYLEVWEEQPITGVPPSGFYGGACASLLDSMYAFGGNDGSLPHGDLYELNTTSRSWSKVQIYNATEAPMKKWGCRMIPYQDDKLVLIGGYGYPTKHLQPGSLFLSNTQYTDGRGWTNEIHQFSVIEKGVWTSSLPTTGTIPPPCAHFSLTSIDRKRAVLFGGYQPEHGKVNAVYIIDLEAMHWNKLEKITGDVWPVERSAHAACCLNYAKEHPQVLVTGGRDKEGRVLKDAWLLDVDSAKWKEITFLEDVTPRAGHSTNAFILAPGLTEVTMFGGYTKWATSEDQLSVIAGTAVLQFESLEIASASQDVPSTKEWVNMGVVRSGQLASADRVREKMTRMHIKACAAEKKAAQVTSQDIPQKVFEERITKAEERVKTAERFAQEAEKNAVQMQQRAHMAEMKTELLQQELCDANRSIQEAEWQSQEFHAQAQEHAAKAQAAEEVARELNTRVEQAESTAQELEHEISDLERTLQETNWRVQSAEESAQYAQQQALEFQAEMQHANRQAQESERRAQAANRLVEQAEERAEEAERRFGVEQHFWVLQRQEIQLSDEVLGEGGWGVVRVATFRGLRVAAKCLHNIIASVYNRDLFVREMTMAARLRHPNLLQFIGATLEGQLIILTEWMPTSLRSQLEREAILGQQIIPICLDVSLALSYLHQIQPDPIVHRDVSSANVLMEPQPN